MDKIIIVYLVALVAVAFAILYLTGHLGGGQQNNTTFTTIHPITSATSSSTTSITVSSTTTLQTTTSVIYSGCLTSYPTAQIENGDFGLGTYQYWNETGPGFGNGPLDIPEANATGDYFANNWTGYQGTYAATTFEKGLALKSGNLTSDPFQVTEPFLDFRLVSSQSNELAVEIVKNGTPVIITHYDTYNDQEVNSSHSSSTFVNASMPLGTLLCQNVSIKVVAGVTGLASQGKGYIAIGDFYLSKDAVSANNIIVNQTINPVP